MGIQVSKDVTTKPPAAAGAKVMVANSAVGDKDIHVINGICMQGVESTAQPAEGKAYEFMCETERESKPATEDHAANVARANELLQAMAAKLDVHKGVARAQMRGVIKPEAEPLSSKLANRKPSHPLQVDAVHPGNPRSAAATWLAGVEAKTRASSPSPPPARLSSYEIAPDGASTMAGEHTMASQDKLSLVEDAVGRWEQGRLSAPLVAPSGLEHGGANIAVATGKTSDLEHAVQGRGAYAQVAQNGTNVQAQSMIPPSDASSHAPIAKLPRVTPRTHPLPTMLSRSTTSKDLTENAAGLHRLPDGHIKVLAPNDGTASPGKGSRRLTWTLARAHTICLSTLQAVTDHPIIGGSLRANLDAARDARRREFQRRGSSPY